MARPVDDPTKRAAAIAMLASGEATLSEVAGVAGESRQLIRLWADSVDWRKARMQRLRAAWRKSLKRAR